MANRCKRCDKKFSSTAAFKRHLKAKHPFGYRLRQLRIYGGSALIVAILGFGAVSWLSAQATLPPTTYGPGHTESYPAERVSTQAPIPIAEQSHIIEHAPDGQPGVLLQFNCRAFDCGSDLIDKLVEVARGYANVYVAPFPRMDAKIALAAQGELETLAAYDERAIRRFIEGQ